MSGPQHALHAWKSMTFCSCFPNNNPLCLLGWIITLSTLEWMIVLFCIGWVISAESFNTAIEYVVDFISPDYHIKAGQIKDLSAGGVLIISITSSIIGIIIFLPKCIKLFLAN
jgi:diacylglycerol kinase